VVNAIITETPNARTFALLLPAWAEYASEHFGLLLSIFITPEATIYSIAGRKCGGLYYSYFLFRLAEEKFYLALVKEIFDNPFIIHWCLQWTRNHVTCCRMQRIYGKRIVLWTNALIRWRNSWHRLVKQKCINDTVRIYVSHSHYRRLL